MNNRRRNFILRFANTLEPQELVRIGGPNVPLEVVPVNEDQNGNAIGNPDEPVPLRVAFRLSGGEIVPGLTYGKRDEINSICLLSIHLCVLIEALCEFLWMRTHWEFAADQRITEIKREYMPTFQLFVCSRFFSVSIYMIRTKLVLLTMIKRKT